MTVNFHCDGGEGLIFGNGTQLYVLPSEKPAAVPQVFELTAKGEVSSTACLAKDFYPKDVEIYVNSHKQDNVSTILSKNGLYSAVSVQNVESRNFTCEVKQRQNMITTSKDVKKSSEQEQDSTENQCNRTDGIEVHSTEQINMLSITVLGIRALFAKALAFNLLLSVKIFTM